MKKNPFNFPPPDRKCQRAGCKNFSIYTVGIRFWATGHTKENSVPAESTSNLAVCEDHSKKLTPEDFLTPEGKIMITAQFVKIGKAAPDWNTVEILLTPIKRGI